MLGNLGIQDVSALFAASTGLLSLALVSARNVFYNYGRINTILEENQKKSEDLMSAIQQVRADVKDLQHLLYKSYMMNPEEARRYLHFHDTEGNVCR